MTPRSILHTDRSRRSDDLHLDDRASHFGPRRTPTMSTIVTIGRGSLAAPILAVLLGACAGLGSQPTSSLEPTTTPEATSRPTPSPTSAPPLTQSFTSTLHGFSMSYPEGWTAQPATQSWTGQQFNFGDPPADFLFDPALDDHLFLGVASQPIGDSTP